MSTQGEGVQIVLRGTKYVHRNTSVKKYDREMNFKHERQGMFTDISKE